ncbi:hypothetical protein B9Z55_026351 [Caenorhabditis nigoni]|uniref:Uncharacterized protein n=1 Tax=Caenorhabditis nigoni TaxID=1611254 RepID=A0A2G5T2W8_9PELO|nr:hypothetical protein B9Z55_026351 [Caenorhabditis nigoni]
MLSPDAENVDGADDNGSAAVGHSCPGGPVADPLCHYLEADVVADAMEDLDESLAGHSAAVGHGCSDGSVDYDAADPLYRYVEPAAHYSGCSTDFVLSESQDKIGCGEIYHFEDPVAFGAGVLLEDRTDCEALPPSPNSMAVSGQVRCS